MSNPRKFITDSFSSRVVLRPVWFLFLFVIFFFNSADAAIPNQIQRIEVLPKSHFTRITIKLASEPQFKISKIPGNRLRIKLSDASGMLFKPLRRYSDTNIGGLLVSRRGNDTVITFAIAPNRVGWRTVHVEGLPALSMDVGPLFNGSSARSRLPGRERIR
ncbi:MAG: hypothetical protein J0653_05075, partial [Deltaproteobacteria bacterium]|nr:hypothetical protein [Deltaproteobacteria bacterium]